MVIGMASIDSINMQSRIGDKGGIDCIIGKHSEICYLDLYVHCRCMCGKQRACKIAQMIKELLSGVAGHLW
jgi:hypothetical protein